MNPFLSSELINGILYTVYKDNQNEIPRLCYVLNINVWDIDYFKMVICNEDGSPRYKKFYKNGCLHCDFGPAVIWYKNNEIIRKLYYIEGKQQTENETI